MNRKAESSCNPSGQIKVFQHSVEEMENEYPNWDSMDEEEKLRACREVEPDEVIEESNVTTDGLHELLVDVIDRNQGDRKDAGYVALGTDGSSTSSSDTALNDERYRTDVTSAVDETTSLKTSTFLGGNEANGFTYNEVGLVTDTKSNDWTLLNHASISSTTKDSTKTLTIEVTLSFS